MINTKDEIIKYFKSGFKESKNFKIGIEHEKFLFDDKSNKRLDYLKIKRCFQLLLNLAGTRLLNKITS